MNFLTSMVVSAFFAYAAIYSLNTGMLKGNDRGYEFRNLVLPFIIVYAVMIGVTLVSKNIALAIVYVYVMEIILAIVYYRMKKYRHAYVFLAMFLIWLGNMIATYALAGVGRNDISRVLWQLPLLITFFVVFATKNFSIKRRGN